MTPERLKTFGEKYQKMTEEEAVKFIDNLERFCNLVIRHAKQINQ